MNERYKHNSINVYLHNSCNLECIYCYRGEKDKVDELNYMNSVHSICSEMFINSIKSVTITGGEPLLDVNLEKYIDYFNQFGFNISLLTNGTIKLSLSVLKKINNITFSVDGSSETMKFQRKVNNYGVIVDNIIKCFDAGVNIHINCVITKYNLNLFKHEMMEFIYQIEANGCKISSIRINNVISDNNLIKLNTIETECLFREIISFRKMLPRDILLCTNMIPKADLQNPEFSKNISLPIFIDLKDMKYKMGDTKDEKLSNILNNYEKIVHEKISQYSIENDNGFLTLGVD